jgi:hypothetical protein
LPYQTFEAAPVLIKGASLPQTFIELLGGGVSNDTNGIGGQVVLGLKEGHKGLRGFVVDLFDRTGQCDQRSGGSPLEAEPQCLGQLLELCRGGLERRALGGGRVVRLGGVAAEELALEVEKEQGRLEVGDVRPLVPGAEGGLDLAEHKGPGDTLST